MNAAPDNDEQKFARALVNPDKSIRDATIRNLEKVVSSWKSSSDIEMLKLWKALFYCMWLADMNLVQQELAEFLAGLVLKFPKTKLSLLYIQMFFRTIMREWHHLDQYRLNKFYSLVRIMLQKSLELVINEGIESKYGSQFLDILVAESLSKVPNGLRYHIADIYLSELWNATHGEVNTDQFLFAIRPFIQALAHSDDSSFQERVLKRIFQGYLDNHSLELNEPSSMDSEENSRLVFRNVTTSRIQEVIFNEASDESTRHRYRRGIYDLHRSFQKAALKGEVIKQDSTTVVDTASNGSLSKIMEKSKEKKEGSVTSSADFNVISVSVTNTGKRNKISKKTRQIQSISVSEVTEQTADVVVVPVREVLVHCLHLLN